MNDEQNTIRASQIFSAAFAECRAAGIPVKQVFDAARNQTELARLEVAKSLHDNLSAVWQGDVSRPGDRLTPALARTILTVQDICAGAEDGDFWAVLLDCLPDGAPGGMYLPNLSEIVFDAVRDDTMWTDDTLKKWVIARGVTGFVSLLCSDVVDARLHQIAAVTDA